MNTIRVREIDFFNEFVVGIFEIDNNNKIVAEAVNIVMERKDPNTTSSSPMKLKKEAAQVLMDDLWHCGIRPSNGEGSVGQIGALKEHLSDLRTILFDKLEIK